MRWILVLVLLMAGCFAPQRDNSPSQNQVGISPQQKSDTFTNSPFAHSETDIRTESWTSIILAVGSTMGAISGTAIIFYTMYIVSHHVRLRLSRKKEPSRSIKSSTPAE